MDLVLTTLDALPQDCIALFPPGPFGSLAWYRLAAVHAMPRGSAACFAVLSNDGCACAVVPLQQSRRRLRSLTTPYCSNFWPILPAGSDPALLRAYGQRLGQFCRAWPSVRLDAMPGEWPGLASVTAGLKAAGLIVESFNHFGNWHEPTLGRSWSTYLAARPGALRQTLRRKLKRHGHSAVLELFTDAADLDRGIAAFDAVYRASWKEKEPFPNFITAHMRSAVCDGTLRLGVLWVAGHPAAAQYWIVADGKATVLKLAHDTAFKAASPGTLLTAMMIRHLIDGEGVVDLDFGRGDDAYKALWATQRRQRVGMLLINPRHPAGLLAAFRYLGRHIRDRVFRRLASTAVGR